MADDPPFPAVWRAEYAVGEFVAAATLLPDGRAVTLDTRPHAGTYALRIRAAGTGTAVVSADVANRTLGPLTASPDGGLVAINAGGSLFVWWTADPAAPPRKVVFGRKHCTGLAFRPSGDSLLAAGKDGAARRLAAPDWRTTATYAWRHGKARGVAVSPDGLLAAAGTDTGKVVVWDLGD